MLPSFVCYADILGYKHLVQQAIDAGQMNSFLMRLRRALSRAYTQIREHSKISFRASLFSIKVFTDNIVIGYPLERPIIRDGAPELSDVIGIFSEFQVGLAVEGFFVRGGIAYGDHYMDKDIVFGDALLKAVNLEKRGGPPRICLDSSAIDFIKRHLEFDQDYIEFSSYYQALFRDADGAIFLNYLSEIFHAFPDGGIFLDILKGHKHSIIRGLMDYKAEPNIRAKFEWAARYHNFFCREYANNIPLHYSIDPEFKASEVAEVSKLSNYTIDIEELTATPSFISLQTL